jgi:hypothetical protein
MRVRFRLIVTGSCRLSQCVASSNVVPNSCTAHTPPFEAMIVPSSCAACSHMDPYRICSAIRSLSSRSATRSGLQQHQNKEAAGKGRKWRPLGLCTGLQPFIHGPGRPCAPTKSIVVILVKPPRELEFASTYFKTCSLIRQRWNSMFL